MNGALSAVAIKANGSLTYVGRAISTDSSSDSYEIQPERRATPSNAQDGDCCCDDSFGLCCCVGDQNVCVQDDTGCDSLLSKAGYPTPSCSDPEATSSDESSKESSHHNPVYTTETLLKPTVTRSSGMVVTPTMSVPPDSSHLTYSTWTDEQGKVHIVTSVPAAQSSEVLCDTSGSFNLMGTCSGQFGGGYIECAGTSMFPSSTISAARSSTSTGKYIKCNTCRSGADCHYRARQVPSACC